MRKSPISTCTSDGRRVHSKRPAESRAPTPRLAQGKDGLDHGPNLNDVSVSDAGGRRCEDQLCGDVVRADDGPDGALVLSQLRGVVSLLGGNVFRRVDPVRLARGTLPTTLHPGKCRLWRQCVVSADEGSAMRSMDLPLLLASDEARSGDEPFPLDRIRMQKAVFLLTQRGSAAWATLYRY